MENRLVVISANQLSSFINSKMVCQEIVIMTGDHFRSNDLRNVKETLILEHFFNIFLAF